MIKKFCEIAVGSAPAYILQPGANSHISIISFFLMNYIIPPKIPARTVAKLPVTKPAIFIFGSR